MKKINIKKEDLEYQYITLGKSRKECADFFKCKEATIKKRLRMFEIKKYKKIPRKELFYQYITLNKTQNECAEYFKCKQGKIRDDVRAHEITKVKKRVFKKKNNSHRVNLKKEDLEYQYIKLNKNIKECAEYFKCSKSTISDNIQIFKIKKTKEKIREKIEQTNMKRYGVKTTLQNKKIYEKAKKTNIAKYGVENVGQNERIKEKIRKTNIEKNKINPSRSDDIKKKIEESNIRKYGVKNHAQKHIKNYEIWESDKLFNNWIKIEYKKLNKKILISDICNSFNITTTIIGKRIKKNNLYKYINFNPRSTKEEMLANWLDKNSINYKRFNRSIIKPLELDFVINNKKIAIEVNDTRTHCIEYRILEQNYSLKDAKNYHNNKTELAKKAGYRLIHVFEKDMNDLDNVLGILLPAKKINARDLRYRHNVDVKDFIIKNHKQHTSPTKYGGALLDKKNNVVAAITFRRNNKDLELDKLCIKKGLNIRGGSSKLFKNYLKRVDIEYESIITFCDTTYHSGKVYEALGFEVDKVNGPIYYWVKKDEWVFRRSFQKKLLQKKFNLSDEYIKNNTEREICNKLGYVSIYTCNQVKYIKKNKNDKI